MSGPVSETAVHVRPYGSAEYWNGCVPREAASIVQLPEEVVQRFIDVLDVRMDNGEANTELFYERFAPSGEVILDRLREMQADGTLGLLCRKNATKNCRAEVSCLLPGGFMPDDGPLESHITVHLGCYDALIDTVNSNIASAAPMDVVNSPQGQHLDMGCHLQLGVVAERTGQLALEQLEVLEAQRA